MNNFLFNIFNNLYGDSAIRFLALAVLVAVIIGFWHKEGSKFTNDSFSISAFSAFLLIFALTSFGGYFIKIHIVEWVVKKFMPTSNGEGQIFNFSELERLTPTIYSYLTPYTAILCGIVLGCWVGIAQKAKNCSYEFWELPLNGAIWALIGVVGVSLVFSIFAVIIHMFIMAAVFIIIVICVIFMGIGSLRDYKNQK